MTVIDVHTHMYTRGWLDLLRTRGGIYGLKTRPDGREEIFRGDTPVAFPQPGHFDYDLRLKQMDAAGIDVSIVSLTCPNVYFGPGHISLKAAQIANDEMAEAQRVYPDRIRFLCSLPWEYPDLAVKELERATKAARDREQCGGNRIATRHQSVFGGRHPVTGVGPPGIDPAAGQRGFEHIIGPHRNTSFQRAAETAEPPFQYGLTNEDKDEGASARWVRPQR